MEWLLKFVFVSLCIFLCSTYITNFIKEIMIHWTIVPKIILSWEQQFGDLQMFDYDSTITFISHSITLFLFASFLQEANI